MFIIIALSTSTGGEDALTQDKLSNLRIVGSGYGPLIYSLSNSAGFTKFSSCCNSVWRALQTNPDLSSMLVSYAIS